MVKEEVSQMNIWKWLENVLEKLKHETAVVCTETISKNAELDARDFGQQRKCRRLREPSSLV